MINTMPFHDVQQGETVMRLARKNALKDWKAILDHSQNAELKKKRPDPGILLPGDRVFIPNRELREHPAAVDARHKFTKKAPDAYLRVVVKDDAGKAHGGKKYELTVAGKTTEGKLGGDGLLEQAVPSTATSGELKVWTEGEGAEPDVWILELGHMDPLDEASGVQARLENLGFDCGGVSGTVNDATRVAIRSFQWLTGLEMTGEIDDALKEKLTSYYEPTEDEAALETAEEEGAE